LQRPKGLADIVPVDNQRDKQMRISVQPELELLPIQTPMPRRATATSGNLERGVEILARWEVGRGLHFEVMPNGILRCDPDPTATYIEDLSAKLSNLVFVSNQWPNIACGF
jgi:hypothetical protein